MNLLLYLEKGTYIGYTNVQQHVRTRSDQQLCSMHAKQLEVSPMASVGQAHRCSPAQPETKLHIRRVSCSSGDMECMPLDTQIVVAGTDDDAIEVCVWTCPASNLA